ncbi:hypothetical protein FRC18_002142 [Serendipita sp. 400]|nr:hypothetical protein FRC18_002142 [Serendipita sp. 400]
MEQFLVENKNNRVCSAGMKDPLLGSSTLSKHKNQGTTKARHSREDQAPGDTKRRKNQVWSSSADEDRSSEDELRLTSSTTSQTRRSVKGSQGLESDSKELSSKEKLQTSKGTDGAKTKSAVAKKAQRTGKVTRRNSDGDEGKKFVPKISYSMDKARSKDSKRPVKSGGMVASRKETRIKRNDIEEIGTSEDELDMTTPKASRSSNVLLSGPRPFPMDLGATLQSSGGSLRSVTSPLPSTATSYSVGLSTKSSSKLGPSTSDGEGASYTQIVNKHNIDPSLLCPFCDQRLPEYPSAMLRRMLKQLERTAKPEPRIGNSLGLSASLEVFAPFCLRHEAEAKEFPKGRKNGWPTTLDPRALAKRTRKLKSHLQAIIDEPDKGSFLRPLQKAAKDHGKGAVNGAKANWYNFENATAGYYGEQGFAIISQVLFDLFPDISPEKTQPLDISNYFSVVLVPETAVLLIQQDLQEKEPALDKGPLRSQALQVLRSSRKYGEAMFPVLDNEEDTIGDDLARERAQKMRKLREDEAVSEAAGSSQVSLVTSVEELSSSDDINATPVKSRKRGLGDSPSRGASGNVRPVLPEPPRPTKRKINLQQKQDFFMGLPDSHPLEKKDPYNWLLSD